jgi:hypothetical protein
MSEEPAMDRPPFDPAAFIVGIALIGIATLGLLGPEVVRRLDLAVLGSALLVAGGALLLVTSLRRDRSRS